jgi:hypothetical protein
MTFTERRERPPPARVAGPPGWAVARTAAIGLGLALAIFLLYFLPYATRHLSLPVGFDPPWYVWRAQHLTAQGVGNGDLAARPGYPVLSAILGSLTGLSQLETTVVLSLVLVGLLALAVGAFAESGLGLDRWRWMVVVTATAVVVGPTHLVGENLSNALNVALEVAALVPLLVFIDGGKGMGAAVVLLVASALAHWDFAALFGTVMGVAFLMALPSSLRERRHGRPAVRTEAGALAALAAWAGGIVMVTVVGILRAPLRTVELGNDELLFRRKFRTDVVRLAVPAALGLAGPWVLGGLAADGDSPKRRRRFAVRFLRAWTLVMAAGMAVGLLTFAVPPARFLAHLVALPGAITVGAIVIALAARGPSVVLGTRAPGRKAHGEIGAAVAMIALAALTVPGALRWYRYPVLLQPAAVQQARTAGRFIEALPPGEPVVFLVDYTGRPGSLSAVLKERTIRMGLPPAHQLDAQVFVGTLEDLLRGRRTPAPDVRAEQFTRRYWEDVRPVLATSPPVVIVESMAPAGYRQALAAGARVVGPGVAILRGPSVPGRVEGASAPREVPSVPAALLYGLVFFVLLWVAGTGWTWALLGPGLGAEALVGVAPLVGAAGLMVVGLGAAEAGMRLSLGGASVVYLAVTLGGFGAAALAARRTAAALRTERTSSTRRSS